MARLAIKGQPTRGSEVIAWLEMLGGKNTKNYSGYGDNIAYFIFYGKIDCAGEREYNCYKVFTLEEFEEKFPYKVGDKVSSKYLKNYKIEKIEWEDTNNRVIYKLQGMGWYAVNELQPYKEETLQENINESFNKTNQVIFVQKSG